jgi:excisionase family DNA binding protein
MTATLERTVLPPEDLAPLTALGRFLDAQTAPGGLIGANGVAIPLPVEVYTVLKAVVEAMREGRAITVVPLNPRLSTQEAAELLGVSRPTLVKLLEEGALPYEQPGRHRRVKLADVLAYKEARSFEQRRAIDEMTEFAQENGFYEVTPEEAVAAVKAVRRERARGE